MESEKAESEGEASPQVPAPAPAPGAARARITRIKPPLWHGDAASPGALSSMDVLMRWLTTPGNLTRWYGQYHKLDMCREVVAALRKEGIENRKASDVSQKTWKVLKNFVAADEWLGASGHRAAFESGTAAQVVVDNVLRMCPQYRELAPAMKIVRENKDGKEKREHSSSDEESDGDESVADGSDDDEGRSETAGCDDSSTEDEGEKRPSSSISSVDSMRGAGTKRHLSATQEGPKKSLRTALELESEGYDPMNGEQGAADDSKPWSEAERGKGKPQQKRKQLTKAEAVMTREVLIDWLTTPGNVARWRESNNKRAVYREILHLVDARGVKGRKEDFVRFKLRALEIQCNAAKQWLIASGLEDDYALGNISEDANAQVEKLCRGYRRIAPVLGVSSSRKTIKKELIEAAGLESSPSGGEETEDDATGDDKQPEWPPQPTPTPRSSSASGRLKRRLPAVKADIAKRKLAVDVVSTKMEVQSPKQESGLLAGADSPNAEQVPWEHLSEEERVQRRDLFKLKRTMLQKELETKQARLDVQLVCDKMMARQKLLGAGVPLAEVDRALPL